MLRSSHKRKIPTHGEVSEINLPENRRRSETYVNVYGDQNRHYHPRFDTGGEQAVVARQTFVANNPLPLSETVHGKIRLVTGNLGYTPMKNHEKDYIERRAALPNTGIPTDKLIQQQARTMSSDTIFGIDAALAILFVSVIAGAYILTK